MLLIDLLQGCRHLARSLVKGAGRCLQRCDPAWLRARRLSRKACGPRTLMLCVYRAKNARFVEALAGQAESSSIEMHLWALDHPVASLAPWTRGSGAGSRMDLLNRLWQGARNASCERVVISDDDIVFTRGDLPRLLNGCERCGFGIAQPAHSIGSYAGRHFPRSRAFTIARLTTWVDTGPMVVISRAWLHRVLPFPEQAGMGWGLGLRWGQLRHEGCRLGIFDGICVRHMALPFLEYETGPESRRVADILGELNLRSTTEGQQCLARWMFWRPEPPWKAAGEDC